LLKKHSINAAVKFQTVHKRDFAHNTVSAFHAE